MFKVHFNTDLLLQTFIAANQILSKRRESIIMQDAGKTDMLKKLI